MKQILIIIILSIIQTFSFLMAQSFEMTLPGVEGHRIFVLDDRYIVAGRGSQINYSNGVMATDVLPEGVVMNSRFFSIENYNFNQTNNAENFSYKNGKFYASMVIAESNDAIGKPTFVQYDSSFTVLEEFHVFDVVNSSADFLLHEHFEDSTVLATGHIYGPYGYNNMVLVNFNLNGSTNWTKTLGCSGNCRATPTSILELNESDFIFATNRFHNYGSSYNEYRRVTVYKLSKETGVVLWHKTYGNETKWQEGGKLIKLQDGRVMYTWCEPRTIGFAVDLLNPNRNIYWAEIDEETGLAQVDSLHGQIPNAAYYIKNVQQLADGSIIISGDFQVDNSFFILKMTPEAEVEWFRRIYVFNDQIVPGSNILFVFKDLQYTGEEFLITGRQINYGSANPLAAGNFTALIRLDEFGCLEPGCQYSVSTETIEDNNSLLLFPNPASDFVTLKSSIYPIKSIQIYDLTGIRLVYKESQGIFEEQIDISKISNGTYIVKVDVGSQMHTYRLVKH